VKKIFALKYFIIISALAIPPCFRTGGDLPLLSYSWHLPILCLIFVVNFLFTKKVFFPKRERRKLFSSLLLCLGCLSMMLLFCVVVTKLSNPPSMELPRIKGMGNIVAFVFSVAGYAFFEEFLYRLFIFEGGLFLLGEEGRGKKIGCFLFALGLFAAAHRYMGLGAVVNAFISGALLQLLYLKTGRIEMPCLTHCAYNFILFVVQSSI
jgi:membrane protease YdiL (CAAX protease family)